VARCPRVSVFHAAPDFVKELVDDELERISDLPAPGAFVSYANRHGPSRPSTTQKTASHASGNLAASGPAAIRMERVEQSDYAQVCLYLCEKAGAAMDSESLIESPDPGKYTTTARPDH
jgi:hypothetical protein